MNIDDLPSGVSQAGLQFDYSVWTPGTTVSICNVPWTNDYRDIVRFSNRAAINSYVDSRTQATHVFRNTQYIRQNTAIRLPIPFAAADFSNYIRVSNPAQPVSFKASNGKHYTDLPTDYYYFITGMRHVAPNTTEFMVQLDVWSTYFDRILPGRGYLERGHAGIANSHEFDNYGRDYLTVAEGLDIGSEYVVNGAYREIVGKGQGNNYNVIIWSTTALEIDAGSVDSPVLIAAAGSNFHDLPNGMSAYWFRNAQAYIDWAYTMRDKPWVMQGITSVVAVPQMNRYGVTNLSNRDRIDVTHTPRERTAVLADNWRTWARAQLPPKYRKLSKFLTSPYCVLEMTSYTGTPLILKPENWQSPDFLVREIPYFSQPGPRILFSPYRYNAGTAPVVKEGERIISDGGEGLDMTTGIYNFPTFSVVNNSYMNYLASNANSINYQFQASDWSQQKALTGAANSYNQSSASMANMQAQSNIGINQATQTNALTNNSNAQRVGMNAGKSVAEGLMGANPASIIGGISNAATMGMSYGIDVSQNNQQLAINNNAAMASTRSNMDTAGYMRDTNKEYADYAAKGDYANAIAGINAKLQDAKLMQPSVVGQVGGEAFNLAAMYWGYEIKVKMVNPGVMRAIGDFWLRYGYSVNRFMTPPNDFQTMSKFTYWKFQEFYLNVGNMPETFKQTIRGIFEKGVTVWRDPADIATISIEDNEPIVREYYV